MGLFNFLKPKPKNKMVELLKSPEAQVLLFEQGLINLRKHVDNLRAVGRVEDAKREFAEFILKYVKPSDETDTPKNAIARISYYIAYGLLPEGVFGSWNQFCEAWNSFAHFPWLLAIQGSLRNRKMLKFEEVQQFQYYQGDLSSQDKYLLIEYPVPPKINESETSLDKVIANISSNNTPSDQRPVLGPYFSAIIYNEMRAEKKIFTLGQSPSPDFTTLRSVEGVFNHGNCGPGSEPNALAFLECIKRFLDKNTSS